MDGDLLLVWYSDAKLNHKYAKAVVIGLTTALIV
jgi:hypothetical protein